MSPDSYSTQKIRIFLDSLLACAMWKDCSQASEPERSSPVTFSKRQVTEHLAKPLNLPENLTPWLPIYLVNFSEYILWSALSVIHFSLNPSTPLISLPVSLLSLDDLDQKLSQVPSQPTLREWQRFSWEDTRESLRLAFWLWMVETKVIGHGENSQEGEWGNESNYRGIGKGRKNALGSFWDEGNLKDPALFSLRQGQKETSPTLLRCQLARGPIDLNFLSPVSGFHRTHALLELIHVAFPTFNQILTRLSAFESNKLCTAVLHLCSKSYSCEHPPFMVELKSYWWSVCEGAHMYVPVNMCTCVWTNVCRSQRTTSGIIPPPIPFTWGLRHGSHY